eukprot:g22087.t1
MGRQSYGSPRQELLLSGNEIGPAGVQALAEGWAWISSLRLVDLSGNPRIGSEGVDLLVDELPFWQQAPFRLALASIDCPEKSAKKLANALRKNPRHNQRVNCFAGRGRGQSSRHYGPRLVGCFTGRYGESSWYTSDAAGHSGPEGNHEDLGALF